MDLTKKQSHYIDLKGSYGFIRLTLTVFLFLIGTRFLFYNNIYIGIFFYLTGISSVMIRDGVQVDIGLKKIRVYTSYFGVKQGKWVSLENFKGIVVSDVRMRTKNGEQQVTRIFLSSFNVYKQQSILLGEDSNRQHAILKAKEIGKKLAFEVKINDMQKK